MEQHGKNHQQNVIAIIPARYASVRLPGKMLREIAGKPLILHTLGQACQARNVSRVIVATDDERIFKVVRATGGEALMTSPDHQSGSDRIAEVAENLPARSIIVNVQGDEPMISPSSIEKAVDALFMDETADMSTVSEPILSRAEMLNGNVVKIVTSGSGHALYFSRSPIPFPREASLRYKGDIGLAIDENPELLSRFRKHTGLYVYRREYLLEFAKMPPSNLEQIEMLEQLRALESGARIRIVEVDECSISVDTQEDLDRVAALLDDAVSLRAATENDIPSIARVYVESVRSSFSGIESETHLNSLSAERRETIIRDRFKGAFYRSFLAENGQGSVVGFIDCGRPLFDDLPHERQVFSFYMLPEFQRKGIGQRLFRRCVAEIVGQGCNSVCLDTLEASPYRKFYEKSGGSIVGHGTHRIDGEDFVTVIYGWDNLKAL